MKKNALFIGAIFLVLVCECIIQAQDDKSVADLWSNNFRILQCLTMAIWFFQIQKEYFVNIQKKFLVSLLLPIIVSLSSYLIIEKTAIIINICTNIFIFSLWISIFKDMGASISLKDTNRTLPKLMPSFFILPLLFYCFVLYQSLSFINAVLILIYILVFSYTGTLSAFLPINEDKSLWITIGIVLLVFANIMNAYHTFLENITWGYPIIRTITTASRCMMIYGIVKFKKSEDIFLLNAVK